jgi:hypothetical protein
MSPDLSCTATSTLMALIRVLPLLSPFPPLPTHRHVIGPCPLCELDPSKSYKTLSTPSTHIYRLLLIQRGHLPSNPLRTAVRPHRDIFETDVDVLEASEHIGDLKSHQVSSQDPLLPSCSCPTACLSCVHPSLASP